MSIDYANILSLENEFDECLKFASAQTVKDQILIDNLVLLLKDLLYCYLGFSDWYRVHDLIRNIDTLTNFPSKDELYRALGDFFVDLKTLSKAVEFYDKALSLNQSNLLAYESWENSLNSLIDRWHYRMINDRIRNKAYFDAIHKRLELNSNIKLIDIGSGTGLLAAQSLTKFKPQVYACEMNSFFQDISEQLLISEKSCFKLLRNHSNEISEEDLSLSKVDFIITEIFDDGLLGEHSLQTLYDFVVVKDFITKKENIFDIIPKYAKIIIFGIECESIRSSSIASLKLDSLNMKVLSNDDHDAFLRNKNSSIKFEPYTTEDLNSLDFNILTEIRYLNDFCVKFNDIEFLKDLCECRKEFVKEINLKIIKSGYLDALVICFDLYLDDEISISTFPGSTNQASCWHQAIYPTFDRYGLLNKDESFDFTLEMTKSFFSVKTNLKKINNYLEIHTSRHQISCLNNFNHQAAYVNKFEELAKNDKIASIGYYSDKLSTFLLEFIFKESNQYSNKELIVFIKDSDNDLAEFLNSYPRKNIKMILMDEIENQKIDYLIYDPLNYDLGILRDNLCDDIDTLISNSLSQNDRIFPQTLKINGFFVESEELLNETTLTSNENLFIKEKFDLKNILDKYKTRNYYSVDSKRLKYKQLTEETTILNFDFIENNEISRDIELKIVQNGKITAFLYYYSINTSQTHNYPCAALMFFNKYSTNETHIKINASLKHNIFAIKIN